MTERRQTVLLVEDNPDDVALTQRALRRSRLLNDLVVASDGVEALDYLFGTGRWTGRDVADLPVLVLLDIHLPRLDGLEVLRRLRADPRTTGLPVVVLTSSTDPAAIAGSYEQFASSCIAKPVESGAFMDVVHRLGLYWLVLNAPPFGGSSK